MSNMPRLVSLGVILAVIVALGITFFQVVFPFLLPLFLAAMTVVVCRPLYRYLLKRTGNKEGWSAGLATAIILSIGLVPIVVGTLLASLQLYSYATDLDHESVKPVLNKVVTWGVEKVNQFRAEDEQLVAADVSRNALEWLKGSLNNFGDRSMGAAAGTTFGVLKGAAGFVVKVAVALAMYAIALFYFFADAPKLVKATESLIPVHLNYQNEMLVEFGSVVRSVVIATFLAAIAQGLATTVAVGILGFHQLIGLFALATSGALVPLIGTAIVWVPCAIWLFASGSPGQAIFLCLYCVIFVGLIDNVVRTYVLNSSTKLHPLLAFISVLGGIEVMGLWGVFIGPIVACCLHALLKIFNKELSQLSVERSGNGDAVEPPVVEIQPAAVVPTPAECTPAVPADSKKA
ncbi:AI-2E family transporter [Planctomicrobium sp. SH668]|uniref:AI-2E family transporter n=1 Tax=Planctomicrobium sp. SH668 TaxID=3448126 RepID=UPI003F5B8AA4